ncbi:MAG: shikimate dehydrogenase [Rikenellaceae bacterium]
MRRFGLIGEHLPHSFSAKYFAEKFEAEGIADCEYSLYELAKIEEVEELLKTPDLVGFNITIPYKQQIMRYLDALSPEAERIGAVNCVNIDSEGRLSGYNTDIIGLRESMVKFLGGVHPERALILGTGGAAQAVQYLMGEMEIEYLIVSRDLTKGNITYDQITPEILQSHKLIINATPLGTYPNVDNFPTLPYAYLTSEHYLYDLVYNPPLTQYLSFGQDRGAHICNGQEMLVGQAEAAWTIWNS